MAKALGKHDDYERFYQQSLGYRKYFDKNYGLLRPVEPDGSFMPNFDPLQGKNFEPVHGFHEGTSWQYSFSIPHDVPGLIKLMGGNKKFVHQLQKCFDESHFDMGNEPDMIYPYLFNYVKREEWRTQKTVRACIREHFSTGSGGLPGNDDTGTMSAWLIYGMMGFYPVSPGNPIYALTTPVFDKITIHLDESIYHKQQIVIETINNKPGHIYIQKMEMGNQPLHSFFLTHEELVQKGTLRMYLGDQPQK